MPAPPTPARMRFILMLPAILLGSVTGVSRADQPAAPETAEPTPPTSPTQPGTQPATEQPPTVQQAEALAQAGRWREAGGLFVKVYDSTSDTVLLYKAAQAYERSGDCTLAIQTYLRHLDTAGDTNPLAQSATAGVNRCKAGKPALATPATDAPKVPKKATDAPPPRIPPSSRQTQTLDSTKRMGFADTPMTWKTRAAWYSVSASAAFLTVGAALASMAHSREQDIRNLISFRDQNNQPARYDTTVQRSYEENVDQAERLSTLSWVSFAIAGAAAATATTFFLLDTDSSRGDAASERISVALTPTSDGAAVFTGWSF